MKLIRQDEFYTCGCACMRMVLNNFGLVVPSELEMIKLLNTNKTQGTPVKSLIAAGDIFGLYAYIEEDASLELAEYLKSHGYELIFIISVDVPHYVVYDGHNNNHVKLYDPFFGITSVLNKKFESNKQMHPHYRWRFIPSEFKHIELADFGNDNYNKSFIAYTK